MNSEGTYTASFKTKVVLESLKAKQSLSELSLKFNLKPEQIITWKEEFLNNADTVFTTNASQ